MLDVRERSTWQNSSQAGAGVHDSHFFGAIECGVRPCKPAVHGPGGGSGWRYRHFQWLWQANTFFASATIGHSIGSGPDGDGPERRTTFALSVSNRFFNRVSSHPNRDGQSQHLTPNSRLGDQVSTSSSSSLTRFCGERLGTNGEMGHYPIALRSQGGPRLVGDQDGAWWCRPRAESSCRPRMSVRPASDDLGHGHTKAWLKTNVVYSCLAIASLEKKRKNAAKKIVTRHSLSLQGCAVVMKPVAKPPPLLLQNTCQTPRAWNPSLAASQHTAEQTAAALLLLPTSQRPNPKALEHTVDAEGTKQAVEKTTKTKTAQLSFR